MKATYSLVAGLAAAVALSGCPVDHRKLHSAKGSAGSSNGGSSSTGGSGGASGGGTHAGGEAGADETGTSANAGQTNEGGNAGEAAALPLYPQLVDGCVDLDRNKTGDCSETELENAGFKTDTTSWVADPGAMLVWSDQNAYADTPSGSAVVTSLSVSETDGNVLAAAGQCLPVASGAQLSIAAAAFIKSGQGDGLAGLSIFFFDQADCMGSLKDSFDASGTQTDAWFVLQGVHTVASGVSSMRVRLTAAKPFRSPSFEARFDDILVHSQ